MVPSVCRVSDLVSSLPPPVGTLPTLGGDGPDQGYYLLKQTLLARYAKYDPLYCSGHTPPVLAQSQAGGGDGWPGLAPLTGGPCLVLLPGHRRSLPGTGTNSPAELTGGPCLILEPAHRRSLPSPGTSTVVVLTEWSTALLALATLIRSSLGKWPLKRVAPVCTETMFHPGCDLQITSPVLAQTAIAGNTSHHTTGANQATAKKYDDG